MIKDMEKYVEEKARELHDEIWGKPTLCDSECRELKMFRNHITQIINDVKGRSK